MNADMTNKVHTDAQEEIQDAGRDVERDNLLRDQAELNWLGAIFDVTWCMMRGKPTYRCQIIEIDVFAGKVYYRGYYFDFDKKKPWHNFDEVDELGKKKWSWHLVEPPIGRCGKIMHTSNGEVRGILGDEPTGRKFWLTKEDVQEHFAEHGEGDYLTNMPRDKWMDLPTGARKVGKKEKIVTEPVIPDKPLCVVGSAIKGLDAAGRDFAAQHFASKQEESLGARDRMKFVTQLAHEVHHEAHKVKFVDILDMDASEHPIVCQLVACDGTRTHAVTIFGKHIYDYLEPTPLPLSCDNLSRCIGKPYKTVALAYKLVPQKKALKRMACEEGESVKRARVA